MEGMLFANRARPLLLGHRGALHLARENTLESYALALEAGLDGVELDIQRTRDGVLVVHHDFAVPEGYIHALSYEELHAVAPYVPRFDAVLRFFEDRPGALINVELKSIPGYEDGRVEALAEMLERWQGRARVWVSSFDPVALYRFKELAPHIPIGFLFFGHDASDFARWMGLAAVHPHHLLVTRDRVMRWHDEGFLVGTWPVNDPEELRRVIDDGVDVVMGDYPERLMAAAGR